MIQLKSLRCHSRENGKGKTFGIQVEFDLSLQSSKIAKSPILYEVRLLWYYMENTVVF
jgi:hypothetical protein